MLRFCEAGVARRRQSGYCNHERLCFPESLAQSGSFWVVARDSREATSEGVVDRNFAPRGRIEKC